MKDTDFNLQLVITYCFLSAASTGAAAEREPILSSDFQLNTDCHLFALWKTQSSDYLSFGASRTLITNHRSAIPEKKNMRMEHTVLLFCFVSPSASARWKLQEKSTSVIIELQIPSQPHPHPSPEGIPRARGSQARITFNPPLIRVAANHTQSFTQASFGLGILR